MSLVSYSKIIFLLSMKKSVCLFIIILLPFFVIAQENMLVEIGPVKGHYTDTTELHWFLLSENNQKKSNLPTFASKLEELKKRPDFKEMSLELESLQGTRQVARVNLKKTTSVNKDTLTFLTGSCAFQYPFPLNAGGKRSRMNRIFSTMAKEKADFMVWTGDNVYYLAGQWNSYKGMVNENIRTRLRPQYKEFLESCPQYATWDDHDYGPNDSDSRFKLKDTSLAVFKKFWVNPYYGTNGNNGVFCHFSQQDCDFFILDSRFHCDKNGGYNKLLGDIQMEWLKEKLKASKANFKFIFSGTQFLPVDIYGETWGKYVNENEEFTDFIEKEKISGIVLISGDRHYSELNKKEREGTYPLYEFTCSPLTSFMDPSYPKNQALRVEQTAIRDQNYGRIKIFNAGKERICRIEEFDTKGKLFWKYDILLSELR
jgi:alkaline phosphatase D